MLFPPRVSSCPIWEITYVYLSMYCLDGVTSNVCQVSKCGEISARETLKRALIHGSSWLTGLGQRKCTAISKPINLPVNHWVKMQILSISDKRYRPSFLVSDSPKELFFFSFGFFPSKFPCLKMGELPWWGVLVTQFPHLWGHVSSCFSSLPPWYLDSYSMNIPCYPLISQ